MKHTAWVIFLVICMSDVRSQNYSRFVYNLQNWPAESTVYNTIGQEVKEEYAISGGVYIYRSGAFNASSGTESAIQDDEGIDLFDDNTLPGNQYAYSVVTPANPSAPSLSPFSSKPWFIAKAQADSAFASALHQIKQELGPQFAFCNQDTAWFLPAVTPIALGGLMKPERPMGTWKDSLNALKTNLAAVTTLSDTFKVCLSYVLQNSLNAANYMVPSGASVRNWSFAEWFGHFNLAKDIGANCAVFTPFCAKVLFRAAGLRDMAIMNVGNSYAGHTFLLVRVRNNWYVLDPTYGGFYTLDNRLATLDELMVFLRTDTLQPLERYTRLGFDDVLGRRDHGLIISKFDLWGAWSGEEPNGNRTMDCRQVYETHTIMPNQGYYDSTSHLLHYIAGLPYTAQDTLVEVRFEQVQLKNDDGSKAYQDADGVWWHEGFKNMFAAAQLPIHFSSLLLMPAPSLNARQQLKTDLLPYFQ